MKSKYYLSTTMEYQHRAAVEARPEKFIPIVALPSGEYISNHIWITADDKKYLTQSWITKFYSMLWQASRLRAIYANPARTSSKYRDFGSATRQNIVGSRGYDNE